MAFRSRFLAAGLLASLSCHPALAEDAAQFDTAVFSTSGASEVDWSGTYFGAALVTPHGDNNWRQASDGLALLPGDWERSAMMLSLGHDWQSGRLTYGAQLSYGDGRFVARPGNDLFISCASCTTEAANLLALRGRVGFAAGQTHFFASGGLARANVTATNLIGLIIVEDTAMTGWTAGVGVERLIGDNLSLAISYDKVDLGTLALPTFLPTGETHVDFGMMQVGMNVRW